MAGGRLLAPQAHGFGPEGLHRARLIEIYERKAGSRETVKDVAADEHRRPCVGNQHADADT